MKWRHYILPDDPRNEGTEPDYRFTLANERTFLAWIRTALALSAGGLAAISLLPDLAHSELLGMGLLVVAFLTSGSAYRHWNRNERAMRTGQPLPISRLPQVMAIATALVAVVAAVLFFIDIEL